VVGDLVVPTKCPGPMGAGLHGSGDKKGGLSAASSGSTLYFYSSNSGGAKWTFAREYICRVVKWIREIRVIWGLDKI